jgi:hypothetical protein
MSSNYDSAASSLSVAPYFVLESAIVLIVNQFLIDEVFRDGTKK